LDAFENIQRGLANSRGRRAGKQLFAVPVSGAGGRFHGHRQKIGVWAFPPAEWPGKMFPDGQMHGRKSEPRSDAANCVHLIPTFMYGAEWGGRFPGWGSRLVRSRLKMFHLRGERHRRLYGEGLRVGHDGSEDTTFPIQGTIPRALWSLPGKATFRTDGRARLQSVSTKQPRAGREKRALRRRKTSPSTTADMATTNGVDGPTLRRDNLGRGSPSTGLLRSRSISIPRHECFRFTKTGNFGDMVGGGRLAAAVCRAIRPLVLPGECLQLHGRTAPCCPESSCENSGGNGKTSQQCAREDSSFPKGRQSAGILDRTLMCSTSRWTKKGPHKERGLLEIRRSQSETIGTMLPF